jgi:hypothetical protein
MAGWIEFLDFGSGIAPAEQFHGSLAKPRAEFR